MNDTMRTVALDDPALRWAGASWVEHGPTGSTVHRLPEWTRAQNLDPAISLLERTASGVRIEFETDATTIELDAQTTMIRLDDDPVMAASFDLVVDGEVVGGHRSEVGTILQLSKTSPSLSFHAGPPITVRFEGLAAGWKAVELWLPHAALAELQALRVDGALRAAPPSDARRWVHYGSSISHCFEAERPTGVWPVVASRGAGVDLTNLGLAGQCHLDQFVARTIRDLDADLISLKLGINLVNADTMRERTFVPAVHGFLDTIRDRHASTPIVIVTPIICPVAEDHPGPTSTADGQCSVVPRPSALRPGSLTLQRIRELHRAIVASRRDAGDANLHLIEGTDLFGPDDVADLDDGLHPNAAGYQRMGERFHAQAFDPAGPFGLIP